MVSHRLELLPGPPVDPDRSPLAALATAHENRAACPVEIALLKSERFADPLPRPPRHNDHAQLETIGAIARYAHYGDDLLHGRRVRWITQSLVARWPALVEPDMVAGERRRPAQSSSGVECMTVLLRTDGLDQRSSRSKGKRLSAPDPGKPHDRRSIVPPA
jgi:hypothetical protein